ncbi:hypothetical protein [uncultured Mediterranean phage uvMED]|nr:hypothetical protein [uncultured Mediterranean phage uvMED]
MRVTSYNKCYNSSNQLSREAVTTHLDSYCFKRELIREAIYSYIVITSNTSINTSYYLLPDRVVKRDFGNTQKLARFNREIVLVNDCNIDGNDQESESLAVDVEDVQNLLRRTTLNMNAQYRQAKDRRRRMDGIDWRTQRVFKVLRRRLSIDRFNQTVRYVGRLSRVDKSDWLDEAEVLYEL